MSAVGDARKRLHEQQSHAAPEAGLTEAERQRVTENPQEFLMRTLSKDQWRVVADCLRIEVADAIQQERAAWVAKIEAVLAEHHWWTGPSPNGAALVADLRALSSDATALESPFGPIGKDGHDGHAQQLNGLLADCPGCASTAALDTVREQAKAEAWDEGHRLAAPHGDRCEPTCPNPYRAADTEAGR